jgi:mono/diheme cytochrome c family protein
LIVIVVLLAAGTGAAYAITENKFNTVYHFEAPKITIPTDNAAIERGKHLVTGIAQCVDCHGNNYAGKVILDNPGIAVLVSQNITSGKGSAVSNFTDADWIRVLRHGVKPDGTPVKFMPSHVFAKLTDDDLAAIIAYIKTVPPVDNVTPASQFFPLGRVLFLLGATPQLAVDQIDHNAPAPVPVQPGPTVEYGKYLVSIGDCQGCHGPGFSGGKIPASPPDWPLSQNITPTGIGKWTEADFFKAMRNGMRPDGTLINPVMPWPYIGQSTDDELRAIFAYLKTLPPKPDGNR